MSQPSRRFWLVSASVTAHLGLFLGVFASGVWRLDKLDAEKATISLAVMSPPAPSGGPPSMPTPKLPHKPHVVPPVIVQPPTHHDEPPTATAEVTVTPGGGVGNDTGPGTNVNGHPDDTGTCAEPPCGGDPTPPAPVKPPPHVDPPIVTEAISPPMLKALRFAGVTDLVPSDNVKMQMMRDDHLMSKALFKICLSETGSISSISMVRGTTYGDYDRTLVDGIRAWQYHPYMVAGRGVPACGMVSFNYSIK